MQPQAANAAAICMIDRRGSNNAMGCSLNILAALKAGFAM